MWCLWTLKLSHYAYLFALWSHVSTFSHFPSTSHSSSVCFVHSLHTEAVLGCTSCSSSSFFLWHLNSIFESTATPSFLLTELSQIFCCIPFSQLQLGCFKNKTPSHMFLLLLILGTISKFCPILFCEILHCSRAFSSILLCSGSLSWVLNCF